MASNLWSWQRAQAIVRPRKVLPEGVHLVVDPDRPVVAEVDRRVDSLAEPVKPGPQDRLVEAGRGVEARSERGDRPATCSTTNWSYGRSRLKARIR